MKKPIYILLLITFFISGYSIKKPETTEYVKIFRSKKVIEVVERCTKVNTLNKEQEEQKIDTITYLEAKPHCLKSPKQGNNILINSPQKYDSVESPFYIEGTANVFEGTFQVQIKDCYGKVLEKKIVSAYGEIGQFNSYKVQFLSKPQNIIIEAFNYDMKSGEIINLIQVPIIIK